MGSLEAGSWQEPEAQGNGVTSLPVVSRLAQRGVAMRSLSPAPSSPLELAVVLGHTLPFYVSECGTCRSMYAPSMEWLSVA